MARRSGPEVRLAGSAPRSGSASLGVAPVRTRMADRWAQGQNAYRRARRGAQRYPDDGPQPTAAQAPAAIAVERAAMAAIYAQLLAEGWVRVASLRSQPLAGTWRPEWRVHRGGVYRWRWQAIFVLEQRRLQKSRRGVSFSMRCPCPVATCHRSEISEVSCPIWNARGASSESRNQCRSCTT